MTWFDWLADLRDLGDRWRAAGSDAERVAYVIMIGDAVRFAHGDRYSWRDIAQAVGVSVRQVKGMAERSRRTVGYDYERVVSGAQGESWA